MCGRLWLGLAWLLLARAPGAAGSPSSPRRPRSYPHLEGDVRWRRLFSSTHFFLRVDPSGRVQGTRWRHTPDSESRGRCPGQGSGEGVQGEEADRKNGSSNRQDEPARPLPRARRVPGATLVVWHKPSDLPPGPHSPQL